MAELKVSILGSKIGKNWGFSPQIWAVGKYEHPYRRTTISGHTASCGSFAKIGPGTSKNWGTEKIFF